MLILTRYRNQRVKVGDGPEAVWVTVVDVVNGRVRLGFEAPATVPIHREEIALRIEEQRDFEKSCKTT